MKKGNLSISDYVAKMESIADDLYLAGCQISEEDLIMAIVIMSITFLSD